MRIKPRWYGGRQKPDKRVREQRLLRAYHERVEDRKRAVVPIGGFNPGTGPYAELYNKEVAIVRGFVRPGDIVLDVGAGYGRLVEATLEEGAGHVIALEPDLMALKELSDRFKTPKVSLVYGVAEKLDLFHDRNIDLVAFVGNSLGMMWNVVGDWEELVCRQREALAEMLRVSRREVVFVVYGKETIESSLLAYEPLQRNIIGIEDGLMLIEERGDNKPYNIREGERETERFIFQKFDRGYLENLLADVGLSRSDYRIVPIPEGKEYGYLVVINV